MTSIRNLLRLGVLAFLLATFLGPVAASAQSLSCDDFANPDAAQHLLDIDDTYVDDLDPDGDGIACNGDDEVDGEVDYLAVVHDEVKTVLDSFDTFDDLMMNFTDDLSEDEVIILIDHVTVIFEGWVTYPETAPEPDAPARFAEIDDLYHDWVAQVGDAGDAWMVFWEAPEDTPDAELDAMLDTHDAAVADAREMGDELLDLVEEAGGGPEPLSVDEYLAAVDEHYTDLVDSFQQFNDIIESGEITDDDRGTLRDIYGLWMDAAGVADDIVPPAGYEDIHAAYLDVANGFTDLYALYEAWIALDTGTDEADAAFDAFLDQLALIDELCAEFDQVLSDAA